MTDPQCTHAPENEQEEWRPVVGWEELYEVSSLGRVRTLVTRHQSPAGRMKRFGKCRAGYPQVCLAIGSKKIQCRIHILVARAFIGEPPPGHVVNHRDGDKWNPRLGNLEYVTSAENVAHAFSTGLMPVGEQRSDAKLCEDDVRAIRQMCDAGTPTRILASRFGVSRRAVRKIVAREMWKHVR